MSQPTPPHGHQQPYGQQPQQPGFGYPPQPQQPGYGYPQQSQPGPYGHGPAPYQPPPPPKKKMGAGKIVAISIGSVFGFFILIGMIASIGDDAGTGKDTVAEAPKKPAAKDDAKPADKPAAKPAPKEQPKKNLSQADQFKAFVAKNGTPAEKSAVEHVIKVQGADEQNDILDTAEIWTDYTGGLMGPDQAKGKMLASAFADWKDSKNGLVTVYDDKGEILSNGNY